MEASLGKNIITDTFSPAQQLKLFKFMADHVSDFVGICDLEFKPYYVNASGLRKVGLDNHPAASEVTVADFFFPEDRHLVMNIFYPKVKAAGHGEIEIRFKHFVSGEPIWMLYGVTLLKDDTGRPIAYGTISRDVTRQKIFEQKILESEERFRTLADQASMFIWMVDVNARITYANRQLLDFLGISHYSEVAVQGGWERVTHPDDLASVYQAYVKGLTKKEKYVVEARLFNSNTRNYEWFLFTGSPMRDIGSEFSGFIGTAINISAQKLLQEQQKDTIDKQTVELKEANEELQRSNLELEQFAYIASHDLQEPLRKIQTFSHLILERYRDQLSTEIQGYVSKIEGSAVRMGELMRDLLEYSRLTYSQESYFKKTDLNKIVNSVLNDFEVSINQKEIRIERQELPSIDAIPLQMNQLMHNLIGNAIKFSRRGVQSYISIRCKYLTDKDLKNYDVKDASSKYVSLEIQDNGIGFSPTYAEQIFGIFQRLNDKAGYSGYGIGLALCRKIVDNHRGLIMAKGQEDQGATFTIILPCTRSSASQ